MAQHLPDKKVLLIAFIYPPLGGPGVQRTLKFTKYLPEFGWQPYVVCGDDPQAFGDGLDPGLLSEIPPQVKIYRRPFVSPYGLRKRVLKLLRMQPQEVLIEQTSAMADDNPTALMPVEGSKRSILRGIGRVFAPLEIPAIDGGLYWSLAILPLCLKIIRREKIHLIYTSSFPYSDHLAGWILKRLTGKPWVADFRDPWTQNPLFINTGWRRKIDEWLERCVLNNAERVICVTPTFTDGLQRLAPRRQAPRFITVENGFDPQDMVVSNQQSAVSDQPSGNSVHRSAVSRLEGVVELAHVGRLYKGMAIPLFEALEELGESGARLCIRFVGEFAKEEAKWLANHHLSARIEVQPRIPHDQAVAVMRAADVLLLLFTDGPEWQGHYPGKLFEYMASGRPILLIGSEGEAAKLIRESGTGCTIQGKDSKTIVEVLRMLATDPESFRERYYHLKPEVINRYERRALTQRLAEIFDRLVNPIYTP